MTFTPKSTIYLCYVPIDNSYQNQIYFKNKNEQFNYFYERKCQTFTNYSVVRGHSPHELSIKVEFNIDELMFASANYMVYKNPDLSDKWYYAFITKMEYVNNETTRIYFEQDVFQTWFFEIEIKPSFVEREHSVTDYLWENIVPEPFNFQDFIYEEVFDDRTLNSWGYLIGSTESILDSSYGTECTLMSGIYQGVYFYYFDTYTKVGQFLSKVTEGSGGDCILFITVIPKFIVENNMNIVEGELQLSSRPKEKTIDFNFWWKWCLSGWHPVKNKKLFSAPFFQLMVTNHNGVTCNYNLEDFDSDADPAYYEDNEKEIQFKMSGDVSATPSVTLYPLDYKNIYENYDERISLSGFPNCAYSTDTFKLWLAKNKVTLASQAVSSGVGLVAGIATFNGEAIANSIQNAVNTANSVYQANMTPNQGHTGNAENNLLTANGFNKFCFYWKKIKGDYAKILDDYFTMYGYQTNQIKEPNLSSRPFFNYVKTIGINCVGGVPSEHMEKFKAIFNNGVTLWKPYATIGDYTVENSPEVEVEGVELNETE